MTCKRFIGIVILVCFGMFLGSVCSAETYYQNGGLFSINAPEGWSASEKLGVVTIANPKGDNGVSIQFKPIVVTQKEVVMQSLINTAVMAKSIAENLKGTITGEKETSIDGVYARQLDSTINLSGQTANSTYIVIINTDKGYAFTITFGASTADERLKMEEAVKSFKFQ